MLRLHVCSGALLASLWFTVDGGVAGQGAGEAAAPLQTPESVITWHLMSPLPSVAKAHYTSEERKAIFPPLLWRFPLFTPPAPPLALSNITTAASVWLQNYRFFFELTNWADDISYPSQVFKGEKSFVGMSLHGLILCAKQWMKQVSLCSLRYTVSRFFYLSHVIFMKFTTCCSRYTKKWKSTEVAILYKNC